MMRHKDSISFSVVIHMTHLQYIVITINNDNYNYTYQPPRKTLEEEKVVKQIAHNFFPLFKNKEFRGIFVGGAY